MAAAGAGPNRKDVVPCRACGADLVFLQSVNHKSGRISRMPVNVVPTDPKFRGPNAGEIDYQHGVHQSHFGTCTDPGRFRSQR